MKPVEGWSYRFICAFLRCCLRFMHPIVHIRGRENLPKGAAMLCCNHSAFSDPIWVIVFGKCQRLPRSMAKMELLEKPLLGCLYKKLGAFPVDRGHADIGAIKTAMQTLKNDDKVLIFPEGTRIKKGKPSEPHSGAIMIATRMKVPVVPIYLSTKKHFWQPVKLIYGEPYLPTYEGAKPTPEELAQLTADLMQKIYALGEKA